MNRAIALILSVSFFVVSQTAVYYVWRWHPLVALAALVGSVGIFLTCHPRESGDHGRHDPGSLPGMTRHWTSVFCAITLIADLVLLFIAYRAGTDETIASPWGFYGPVHFFLYGLATWALLIAARYRKTSVWPLTALHFFTTYSVVAFVVKLGFGFDPFIHRAAIRDVIETGTILPKQPYYVGEYVTLASLRMFTQLPLVAIERFFMPVVAALTLPGALFLGLRDGWGLRDRTARVLSHVVLLMPMMPLTFTVPHNITVLIWIITVFLGPALAKQPRGWLPLLALGLLSLSLHPLLGIPTLVLALSFVVPAQAGTHLKMDSRVRGNDTWRLVIIFLLQALLVPLMFLVNQYRLGGEVADWNPFSRLIFFRGLFFDPYASEGVPVFWRLLYGYWLWLPLLAAPFVVAGIWLSRHLLHLRAHLATVTGMLIALFLMSTLFVIPGIISYEQMEFSLRFKHSIGIALLPLIAVTLAALDEKLRGRFLTRTLAYAALAVFMTTAWYFTHPQINPKVPDAGRSVSRADVAVIEFIDARNTEQYVVLSDQITAVAARERFGFNRNVGPGVFFYPLPASGTLGGLYESMIWNAPRRETMDAAMRFAGVHRAYFVVLTGTYETERLVDAATLGADGVFLVDEGRVVVFEYLNPHDIL